MSIHRLLPHRIAHHGSAVKMELQMGSLVERAHGGYIGRGARQCWPSPLIDATAGPKNAPSFDNQ